MMLSGTAMLNKKYFDPTLKETALSLAGQLPLALMGGAGIIHEKQM